MEDLKDYPRLIPTKFDEEAYELIKLHCPFCGAEAKDGCRHRLLVLGDTYFEALSPEFIAFTRRLFGFKDDEELTLGTLIPIRLWGTVKQNEDMALAAAYAINRVLPNGDAVAFFRIRSRARHETRSAAFISDRGLAELRKALL